ncbi:hypothetical protein Ssi03_45100 [Sphaerisporangium siamense]|nr:hypothetical protein Ssi03_45100 [Sphaerisporangium siamense]
MSRGDMASSSGLWWPIDVITPGIAWNVDVSCSWTCILHLGCERDVGEERQRGAGSSVAAGESARELRHFRWTDSADEFGGPIRWTDSRRLHGRHRPRNLVDATAGNPTENTERGGERHRVRAAGGSIENTEGDGGRHGLSWAAEGTLSGRGR